MDNFFDDKISERLGGLENQQRYTNLNLLKEQKQRQKKHTPKQS
jgi:hypothetical protein